MQTEKVIFRVKVNFSKYTQPPDALKINIDSTHFYQLTSIL